MEELTWYRDELGGEYQCPSHLPFTMPNGKKPRCRLAVDHTMEHGGDGFIWTDEEEEKLPSKFSKILKVLQKIFFAIIALSVVYAFYKIVTDLNSEPPIWWYVLSYGSAVLLLVISGLRNRVKRKER